jgi:hypothetical protein
VRQYVKTRYFETHKQRALLNHIFPGFFLKLSFYPASDRQDLAIQHVYKSLTHIKSVCQSALYSDIETNPGPPFYIDPTVTIKAPYSQGSVSIFGETMSRNVSVCSNI